jgi:DNA repair protein RecN (Recombination protein N)
MLQQCTIRNFALIEEARVEFAEGFHVLTGETGAGKSIIIDALSLIAGGRGSAEWVRHGAGKAEIECVFSLPENHPVYSLLEELGIPAERGDDLIIRREMTVQGKSFSRVNGMSVNLAMLKAIGEWLVNIHGQHEHQSLLHPSRHIGLLDEFGGGELLEVKREYDHWYGRWTTAARELAEWEENSRKQLQMADLYRFQIKELTEADLKPDEDEELEAEKRLLAHAEKLAMNANEAYDSLYGGRAALELVDRAVQRLQEIIRFDPTMAPLLEQVQEAYFQLEDAAFQLRDYRERIEFQPDRLERIERRLDLLHGLRRKYGQTVREMMEYLEKIRAEMSALEHSDEKLEQLRKEAEEARRRALECGAELGRRRRAAADRLAGRIMEALKELQMEKTVFSVEFRALKEPGANGLDEVEFMISPNPGEPLKPLHRIASGGELSRIMLAVKSIVAENERIPVLVFDEVDTGVSGRAAQAIAEKLARLARKVQVFSVTHLPQVACMADVHFLVDKRSAGGRTFTEVRPLGPGERETELARMLGGVEITDTTALHAKEMLALAAEKKEAWRDN